jgi:hypothetical protein
MKIIVASLLLVLIAAPAFPEQSDADRSALLRRANVKFWMGVGLASVGAFTMPITGPDSSGGGPSTLAGLGMMAAGSVLVWSSAVDRRRAQPEITFGVRIGRSNSLVIRRAW